jgi:hypothetical protein
MSKKMNETIIKHHFDINTFFKGIFLLCLTLTFCISPVVSSPIEGKEIVKEASFQMLFEGYIKQPGENIVMYGIFCKDECPTDYDWLDGPDTVVSDTGSLNLDKAGRWHVVVLTDSLTDSQDEDNSDDV